MRSNFSVRCFPLDFWRLFVGETVNNKVPHKLSWTLIGNLSIKYNFTYILSRLTSREPSDLVRGSISNVWCNILNDDIYHDFFDLVFTLNNMYLNFICFWVYKAKLMLPKECILVKWLLRVRYEWLHGYIFF